MTITEKPKQVKQALWEQKFHEGIKFYNDGIDESIAKRAPHDAIYHGWQAGREIARVKAQFLSESRKASGLFNAEN